MWERIRRLTIKFRQLITFGIVGVINTGADFLTFSFCHSALRLSPVPSQAIGYLAGVACSFILNRNITFRGFSPGNVWSQIFRFVAVNAASLLISAQLIGLMTAHSLHAYFSKVVVTGVVMVINFFGYKFLVFKSRNSEGEDTGDE